MSNTAKDSIRRDSELDNTELLKIKTCP